MENNHVAEAMHALRNPLAAIIYAAELQAKLLKMPSPDATQLARTVEIILKSAKQLQDQIATLKLKP